MKKLSIQALILLGAGMSIAQDGTAPQHCSEHPNVTRQVVTDARTASHGIHEQHELSLKSRPPGQDVSTPKDPGGGDCPSESTMRGSTASAVGALLYNGGIHCSAVLVGPTMILTAAHCIKNFDPEKLEFVLGLDSEHPIQRTKIYRAAPNPDYDESRFGVSDIAYAYLMNQMTEATPVLLPEDRLPRNPNLSLLHVGYGIAGMKPGARRCVDIPVQDRCDASFSYSTTNMNTCNGDSGGGAFRDLNEKIVLAGLTDWGDSLCSDFGVDVDVGNYRDWIQARKSEAPRNVPFARVEPSARQALSATPDQVAKQLSASGPIVEAKFNSFYKGRWVTWEAIVDDIRPRNDDDIPGTCGLLATAGQAMHLYLPQYPDGCAQSPTNHIYFTGRLARIGAGGIDVALAEPVTAVAQGPTEPVAEWSLARLAPETRDVREQRSREVRLESRHGSWSGRVTECLPVNIEAPWRLDRGIPITFTPAHTDHAGYLGGAQNIADQGFCVPFWAEGYGGTQAFGATLDAGMVGVVSGVVNFGVVRVETTLTKVAVAGGSLSNTDLLNIPLKSVDQYEVHLKLRDGSEKSFSDSGNIGNVKVNWGDGKVVLRSEPKIN